MYRGLLQLKDVDCLSSTNAIQNGLMPVVVTTPPQSAPNSRPASPYSRQPSPPRSLKPIFSRGMIASLSKSNVSLNQEIKKLQNQLKSLRNNYEIQEVKIKKLTKESKDTSSRTAQQSARCGEARHIVDSISIC
ncbi:hypothetical protein MLD38_018111 [Melastoma candidum]|uniref:Uncharacterized protein n=1 Tax=Melastoma candidum TaxID=119954 RepID=A0ACB9R124_9MYRT|nr:hypothetical protein MLD38_040797 [Melastoma candidum]KAI4369697.1 hypothetical protein MLD38_018111 [Melastoma candidum]